tara:strand:- start:7161 stop:7532 length:372 start_codon:yes stop_codon:yes gene_type:complete
MYKDLIISSLVMLGLDASYISLIKDEYLKQIQDIQTTIPKVNMVGVVLTYIIMIFGINYFILQKKASLLDAFLFGIVLYGVYDGTTYALFSKWSTKLAIMDVLWGGILMMTTTYLTYRLSSFF